MSNRTHCLENTYTSRGTLPPLPLLDLKSLIGCCLLSTEGCRSVALGRQIQADFSLSSGRVVVFLCDIAVASDTVLLRVSVDEVERGEESEVRRLHEAVVQKVSWYGASWTAAAKGGN
jgi:hypothetical protein